MGSCKTVQREGCLIHIHYCPTAQEKKRFRWEPHLDIASNGQSCFEHLLSLFKFVPLLNVVSFLYEANINGIQPIDDQCEYSGDTNTYAGYGPVVLDFRAGIIRSIQPLPAHTRAVQNLGNIPDVAGYMSKKTTIVNVSP